MPIKMISYGVLLVVLFVSGYALSGQSKGSSQFWLSILAAVLLVVAVVLLTA